MSRCLICNADVEPFMDLGRMPIANGFLDPPQFEAEFFFNLVAGFCPQCTMVQLTERVDPHKLFHDNYAFFSSTSTRMGTHFKAFAESVVENYLSSQDEPFVVEMGSNDGIMLRHFAARRIRHLGIEPSANVAQVARENGVQTIVDFFDERLARAIVSQHGQADAFLCANVMCHIPDLHSIAEGIRLLLKPGGVLIFEDPYVGDILEKVSYDQIYDEHVFYFSITSVSKLFARHGLQVVDVERHAVHGGSMRYVIAHAGTRPVSPSVEVHCAREEALGLGQLKTYRLLRDRVETSRAELVELLETLKQHRKRVAGYAATSKSTTVINYCGITPDLLEYISDTTPLKIGKYSPGAHIPIRSHEDYKCRYPDYALLFGWNHAEEIMAKERDFQRAGGRWIVYVPKVEVVQ